MQTSRLLSGRAAQCAHAVSGERDSTTIFGLNGGVNVEVDAVVGTNPEGVDAFHRTGQPAGGEARKGHVDASTLKRDFGLARNDG